MSLTVNTELSLEPQTGSFTRSEIWGQPDLWKAVFSKYISESQALKLFVNTALAQHNIRIVLTGAGTSAYIGISLTGVFMQKQQVPVQAIPTTDLVTHASEYLLPDQPVLLVSFARSGNSPESVEAVRRAEQVCKQVFHIIITCDPEGSLAKYNTRGSRIVFSLPPEANDKSLAMTGSYSGMLLTGILLAYSSNSASLTTEVDTLYKYGTKILEEADRFRQLAEAGFHRAVFLGSGALQGTATEAHLKLQELTDGKVICKHDTFLGLRHGPKAVIDTQTLVYMFFSNNAHTLLYEKDLIASIGNGQQPLSVTGITEIRFEAMPDDALVLSDDGTKLSEALLAVCFILPAQLLGYFSSLKYGLNPDRPSASGAISRVVEGVIIYPYPSV
jgi:tagatose-6-phosphate ketose/aldose isomerase